MLLKIEEAAELCRVSTWCFKRWVREGRIPATAIFKPSRRCVRYRSEILDKWIAGKLESPEPRRVGRPRRERHE
ncbi:helix-turn-helix transcriptional regulator [Synechococcus sp. C9]|uniref:helix-turn-helix transcriptional regulator n=1 Tax=Synechococcus sp. C9 TaxID=102119 RepID=UPI00403FD46D